MRSPLLSLVVGGEARALLKFPSPPCPLAVGTWAHPVSYLTSVAVMRWPLAFSFLASDVEVFVASEPAVVPATLTLFSKGVWGNNDGWISLFSMVFALPPTLESNHGNPVASSSGECPERSLGCLCCGKSLGNRRRPPLDLCTSATPPPGRTEQPWTPALSPCRAPSVSPSPHILEDDLSVFFSLTLNIPPSLFEVSPAPPQSRWDCRASSQSYLHFSCLLSTFRRFSGLPSSKLSAPFLAL